MISQAVPWALAAALYLAAPCGQTEPAAGAAHTLIIAGLGGEPQYEQRFREQAAALAAAARTTASDDAHVVVLTGAEARGESVRGVLRAWAQALSPADNITIVLIGHGSFDGEEYRFNLPGPDLTGSELGQLFDQLPARAQLIVNATSASGAIIDRWQREGRLIVTATKSGGERTATRFAQYWVQAVTSAVADLDKNEVVTASEAFAYVSRQVAADFKADVALATEHARLQGAHPERVAVAWLGATVAAPDAQMSALLGKRSAIERDLDAVRQSKAALNDEEYYDALEAVLVRLAVLQKEIDARGTVQR